MNNLETSNNQTPIEIALGIDENGMTTASKLYEFLELSQSNYSKWCKANITENQFAEENVDYTRFVIKYESGVGTKEREDYKLTAHFAKKLSCKGNGEKAEQAREYFTTVEERVKQLSINRSQLSPQLQLFQQMFEAVAEQERTAREAKELAEKAIETTDNIKKAVKPIVDNWREEMNVKFNRIQRNADKQFSTLRTEMYVELERRAGCDLSTRLRNKKQRMVDGGCTKTEINNTNKMDIIEESKTLREIFSKIVAEYEIRYCA